MLLKDRVALITAGAGVGIGRAVAVLFAREGADVAIVYLPEEQSDAEVTESTVVAEGRRCLLIPGDVRDSRFCDDAVQATVDVSPTQAAIQTSTPAAPRLGVEDVTQAAVRGARV